MRTDQTLSKNVCYVSVFFLITFISFVIYTYFKQKNQVSEKNLSKLSYASQSIELKTYSSFDDLIQKFNNLASLSIQLSQLKQLSNIDQDKNKEILDELFENYFKVFGLEKVEIYSLNGKKIYSHPNKNLTSNTFTKNISWKNYYRNSVYLSDLFNDPIIKKPAFASKIELSLDNKNAYFVEIKFNGRKSFNNQLESEIYFIRGQEANLVRFKKGEIIFISDSKYLGDIAFRLKSNSNLLQIENQIKRENRNFLKGVDYRREPIYAFIKYLSRYDWFLFVKIDQVEAVKETSKFYFGIYGAIFFTSFFFIVSMINLNEKEGERYQREQNFLRKQRELIRQRYEYILKVANDAIIITDRNNRIIDFNNQFVKLYEINESETQNLSVLDLFTENLKNQWNDILRNIKENDGLVFEAIHKKWNGENFHVEVSAKFFEIDSNEFLIQIIRDFEERKKIEDELRSAKLKAEEADRLKSNFLSMMSHEVRTPINIILGAVDLLQSNLSQEIVKQNEHLFDMITRNGKRLLTLIGDIIDISRIESNELKLEFIVRNVESLILDVIGEYEPIAKNKGLQIVTNFKAQNPYARVDEVRFLQIITNLVSNAIKFTSSGGITISTENVNDTIHISVKDTGVGISEQALEHIFKMFRQAHEGYGRNFEGAGLGLTITQKLTKMMGGEIKVKSQVNVGSVFTVIFPILKSEELDEQLLETLEERHRNTLKPIILIVNNDKDEAFYLESLMIRLGFEYFTLNEGKKILSFIKHKPVDCIIYSVNLQNELEVERVMEKIRMEIKLENLKMIALRSQNGIITEAGLKNLGFNLVKTKPISFEDISKILYQVLAIKT